MAKKYLTISDLTGKPIDDENDVVTIAVLEHPALERPVQLDASQAEVKALDKAGKDYVLLELITDGGDSRERLVLELADFEKVIKSGDPQEILDNAEPYQVGRPEPVQEQPRRRGRPPGSGNAAASGPKLNYKELPNAGIPHRGRTTEEEAATVRDNLDEVNKNRVAGGHPPIDPTNPKDAARYGFKLPD